MEEMVPSFPSKHNVHIQGVEDLRVFNDSDGALRWVGTSMEYSHDAHIRQLTGKYNLDTNTLSDPVSMKTPQPSDCEKNWIPLGNNEFIYGWHPYRIGKLEGDTLVYNEKMDTPRIFEHINQRHFVKLLLGVPGWVGRYKKRTTRQVVCNIRIEFNG
jgi:hypothetical protein